MSTIKGQNVRIFATVKNESGSVMTKVIAAATSATLHVAADVSEITDKDCDGEWKKQDVEGKTWDISGEAYLVDSAEFSALNGFDIEDLVGNRLHIEFAMAEGSKNRTMGDGLYGGYVIVKDWNVQADNKQNGTVSFSADGDSELVKCEEMSSISSFSTKHLELVDSDLKQGYPKLVEVINRAAETGDLYMFKFEEGYDYIVHTPANTMSVLYGRPCDVITPLVNAANVKDSAEVGDYKPNTKLIGYMKRFASAGKIIFSFSANDGEHTMLIQGESMPRVEKYVSQY